MTYIIPAAPGCVGLVFDADDNSDSPGGWSPVIAWSLDEADGEVALRALTTRGWTRYVEEPGGRVVCLGTRLGWLGREAWHRTLAEVYEERVAQAIEILDQSGHPVETGTPEARTALTRVDLSWAADEDDPVIWAAVCRRMERDRFGDDP